MDSDIQNIIRTLSPPLAVSLKNTQKPEEQIDANLGIKQGDQQGSDEADAQKVSQTRSISLEEGKKLVEEGNKVLENAQRSLQFKIDDSTSQIVMSIVDKKTGEIIRQVPAEEVLELAKRMQEALGEPGSLVRDRA